MDHSSAVFHDPDGPVVVMEDVPLAVVWQALGTGRWIARPGSEHGWAVVVTRDADSVRGAVPDAIPVVAAADDEALTALLRSFDDGSLVSEREAEAMSWIESVRAEEARNMRDARRSADARVEQLQARIDELERHIRAIESSRAWHLSRRLVSAKSKLRHLRMPRRRR